MVFELLPERFRRALLTINCDKITEMRLRVGLPIVIEYAGRQYLCESGITQDMAAAMRPTCQEIFDIVFRACESSIYSYNEEIKQGFVTLANGARIGLCGDVVIENGQVKTIKNFSSLNIRFPHIVKNCSLKILQYLYDEKGIHNTLIVAPPAAGKTTFIRDICTQFCDKHIAESVLVVDERREICANQNGQNTLYSGNFVDVYSGGIKDLCISSAIRTMSPEVIVLDEISSKSDADALLNLVGAGVKFLATTHCSSLDELKNKPLLREFLSFRVIERFVVLSTRNRQGTVEYVYDQNENCLFYGR